MSDTSCAAARAIASFRDFESGRPQPSTSLNTDTSVGVGSLHVVDHPYLRAGSLRVEPKTKLLAQRCYQRRTVRVGNREWWRIQGSQLHHSIIGCPLQIDIEAAIKSGLLANLTMILNGTDECFREHVDRDGPTGHLSRKRSKLTGLHTVNISFTALPFRCSSISAFNVALPKLRTQRPIRMSQCEDVDRSLSGFLMYAHTKSIGQEGTHHDLEFVA